MYPRKQRIVFSPISTGRLIVLFMIPSLLIDSITGWMALNAPTAISLSQIYRSGMLVVFVCWMACFWKRGFMLLFGVLTMLLTFITWHSFSATNYSSVGMDLRFNLSLFSNLIYFIFFLGYLRYINNNIPLLLSFEKTIFKIIRFSFYVIAINIVLGIFGIGYSTLASYEHEGVGEKLDAGGKGFFIAGNDLSSVFLIVAGMLLIKIWANRNLISYLAFAVALLFLAIMLLTKAVILGMLILVIGIPISMSWIISGWRLNYRPLLPLFFGLLLGAVALAWLISSDSAIVRRAVYLYESADLLTAVTTGRSNFFSAAMNAFGKYYNNPIDWMFGMGWDGFLAAMNKTIGSSKTVEIDYIDIFMMNGWVGLVMTLLTWVWYLRSAYIFTSRVQVARAVLFIDIFLLCLAGASGHILYSAMNGLFVALLNILPFIEMKKQNENTV